MMGQTGKPEFPTGWTFVCVIGGARRGPVKIGMSASPEVRLANLQTSYPYRLTILARFSGGEDEEAAVHRLFRPDRLEGEWFRRSAEILQFIDMLNFRVAFHQIVERFSKQRSAS